MFAAVDQQCPRNADLQVIRRCDQAGVVKSNPDEGYVRWLEFNEYRLTKRSTAQEVGSFLGAMSATF